MSLCIKCAKIKKTCCQSYDTYCTKGDIERINKATSINNFYRFKNYNEYAKNIIPSSLILSDSTCRILKQKDNGDCTFLTDNGCSLSYETRPLICRIYPYIISEKGISGSDSSKCPISFLEEEESIEEATKASMEEAVKLHKILFDELKNEAMQ